MPSAAGKTAPAAWWGEGDSPERRWPGVAAPIPCEWSADRERWESPDGLYWFDTEAADFAEQFFPTCLEHHIGNDWNGLPFELMPYQRVIVRALFGWKRTEDGLRRFRKVFLAVPKGNGKSPFGAGLGLFLAFFDGEAGAEVYCVAAERKQARIVFDSARLFVQRNPRLAGRFEVFRDHIDAPWSNSSLHVISSDAASKHGFRPHAIIFDEFHAQPNRILFDTLYRGMGKRRQPVLVMITTAGHDDESICAEEWEYARRVVSGAVEDPVYLPFVFEAGPKDDWLDEATWARVNPGYGITMKRDYFVTEAAAAQAEPRKRNSFLQLHLNRWVNQATAWIPVEWWDACETSIDDADLLALDCGAGLDLAQKWDLAAFVVVFRRYLDAPAEDVEVVAEEATGELVTKRIALNYELTVRPFFWIPEETMHQHEREDRVPYSRWVEDGLVTATEGAVIDYNRIYRDITAKILPRFPKLKQGMIGYDPAFATDLATRLRDLAGLKTIEVLQNFRMISEPAQIVEALIKGRRVRHDGHRVLRAHWENVAVKTDDAKRIRPVKPRKASKHIDGAIAMIMADKAVSMQERAPSFQMFFAGPKR